MPRGGYQQPAHPAAVSGPGALSARTDGGAAGGGSQPIADPRYGEQQDFHDIQGGANIAAEAQNLVPLDAPTQNPGEPVTAGASLGAGVGPQAIGLQMDDSKADYENMKPLIPGLELIANLPGSNASTRTFVRKLKSLAP